MLTSHGRIWVSFLPLLLCLSSVLSLLFAPANFVSAAPSQEEKKSHLYWQPPDVDKPLQSLSPVPPCSLPDVLKQAGQRAEELLDHLQNFIAHERIRFEQTDRTGSFQMSLAGNFDYLVDFGRRPAAIHVKEIRNPLDRSTDKNLGAALDKGLPVLALIFSPELQGDYDMTCDGSSQWNNQPVWVIHFRQIKGKHPRTMTMETATEVHPHSETATELRPLSLKGRAWIAAGSGQVMHLETNLVDPILMIDLRELSVSVDYAPVKFKSRDVEVWLPKFAVAYTDYAGRRMIIEHVFSEFQLFSVQTREGKQKSKEP